MNLAAGAALDIKTSDQLAYEMIVNDFERDEREFTSHFLSEGDVFVDVGANVGIFSVLAAKLVGPSGEVHAFEPARDAFEQLSRNMVLNGFSNVEVNRVALSDKPESRILSICEDRFSGWNSLASPIGPAKGSVRETYAVNCGTLDDYVSANHLTRIDLMKIDVEGWEEFVLLGGKGLLTSSQSPVLLVEFCESAQVAAGSSCARLRKILESFGYSLYRFSFESRAFTPEPREESYVYTNLVATKEPDRVIEKLRRAL